MRTFNAAVLMAGGFFASHCGNADAADTVLVNGYIFQCQTMCVVSMTSSGLVVSDSNYGWVQMMVRTKPIPVPQSLASPLSLDGNGSPNPRDRIAK